MKRVNEILAVILLSLAAVLVAAIGLRAYDAYVIKEQEKQEQREQEEVLARNRQANDRVLEMRREIEELSEDREMLVQFLEEIQTDKTEVVIPVSKMMDEGMSGSLSESDMTSLSENAADMSINLSGLSENALFTADNAAETDEISTDMSDGMTIVSDHMTIMSEKDGISENALLEDGRSVSENDAISGNNLSVSENDTVNDTVSGNGLSVSGNDAVSGNGLSVSGNDAVSGNGLSVSGNDVVSGNSLSVSGNDVVSGNMLSILQGLVSPKISLEERRKIRSSYEETLLANAEDIAFLDGRQADFSAKKIACLGDSITAAANLEGQENYPACSYPSVLQELLGAKEVVNLGIGGSTIGRYWSDPFVERYREIPQDTDIIIVMGGTNDGFCLSEKEFGTLAERKQRTFCGDLDELMRGLKDNYPEAEIYFATPLPNILQDYLMRERSYLLPQKDLADVILTLSARYDFRVIDLYNSNILDSHDADIVGNYMSDGVHANEAGYRILAQHIAAELLRYEEGKTDSLQ